MSADLPVWLRSEFNRVLVGEIYPDIRAIAVKYSTEEKKILIRCYLDREPNDDDSEVMSVAITEIYSAVGSDFVLDGDIECIFSEEPFNRLDPLDGFIYGRKEWS